MTFKLFETRRGVGFSTVYSGQTTCLLLMVGVLVLAGSSITFRRSFDLEMKKVENL